MFLKVTKGENFEKFDSKGWGKYPNQNVTTKCEVSCKLEDLDIPGKCLETNQLNEKFF